MDNVSWFVTDYSRKISYFYNNCFEFSVNEKRTNCFVELLETVNRLHKDEYKKLASRELSQHCWSNNTMCISRRNVFIDLLLVKGENITQDLTIQHFLQNKDVNETDLFRIFFHIGKIEAPTLVQEFFILIWCFFKPE